MVNRWGNNVNSDRLYFLLQNHWRWWLQPQNWKTLAPWKERYDKFWQHIEKQRLHFADKGPHSQSCGFSSSHVWMWELDCKTLKDWCFQIVVLEKILRVPWTARRSNQSILKEINPEYSLEELILKLKLQYFGLWCEELTHWKRLWCWERLRAGGEAGDRGWDDWMASLI